MHLIIFWTMIELDSMAARYIRLLTHTKLVIISQVSF